MAMLCRRSITTLELVTEAPAELKTSGEYDRILA